MIHIVVVGDHRRERMASKLFCTVDADYLSMDPGRLGCKANHLQAWHWHRDHPAEWAVTLEDDAVPVDDFRAQALAALAAAPTPLVSFYLGRGYIDDTQIGAHMQRARRHDTHWLLSHGPRHAVAIALRTDLVESMISDVQRSHLAIDHAMSWWARRHGYKTAYSVPSLVDHRDEPSLVHRHRRAPRVAWCVGTREQWCGTSVEMV